MVPGEESGITLAHDEVWSLRSPGIPARHKTDIWLSSGVYLETAQASNLGFYERADFVETGHGTLGDATLWCMYLPHERRRAR